MERIKFTLILIVFPALLFAQTDSAKSKTDTIHVGNMMIIKRNDPGEKKQTTVQIGNRKNHKQSNVNTSDLILDLGFANWTDKTDYAAATSQGYLVNKPGTTTLASNDLKLRSGKSTNVNLWFFMQRINLIRHYVNIKYGIGLEMHNYRFNTNLTFKEDGANPYNPAQTINHAFIFRDSVSFSKDKLAADYVTIPFMLNFRTNPNNSDKGLTFSAGVSIGYLYSSRNKEVSSERGKQKKHDDFDLEKWKFSYIAELGIGPVRLYGSYSPNSIFEQGFKLLPYNVGFRLSNW